MPTANKDAASQVADKYEKVPVRPEEIGGTLISIVTKGLYTNPLDCIREYVQNGVDAGANEVTIQITGHSIIIHDNGAGMTVGESLRPCAASFR